MPTFELSGTHASLCLEGGPPPIGAPYFAWDYGARLSGHSLQANIQVGDDNPADFVEFFESLARDWLGWEDARRYESLDGTLSIVATHDGIRAINFEVTMRGDARTEFDWSATHELKIEPGALDALANSARAFVG